MLPYNSASLLLGIHPKRNEIYVHTNTFTQMFIAALFITTQKWTQLTSSLVDELINKMCYVLCLVTQSCPTLCDLMDCSPPGSPVHGGSPGKNTRVGCHGLLQVIFPTQGSNPSLLHCRQILYQLSHKGIPQNVLYPLEKNIFSN